MFCPKQCPITSALRRKISNIYCQKKTKKRKSAFNKEKTNNEEHKESICNHVGFGSSRCCFGILFPQNLRRILLGTSLQQRDFAIKPKFKKQKQRFRATDCGTKPLFFYFPYLQSKRKRPKSFFFATSIGVLSLFRGRWCRSFAEG